MTRFFHATMTVVVLIVIAISVWGMNASGIRVPFQQLLPKIGLYALILVAAAVYKYRQCDSLVAALMIVFWMGLVSDLHIYPMFLAGRQQVEYCDATLAEIDRAIGIEVMDVMAWI